jgi:hypothetical protein
MRGIQIPPWKDYVEGMENTFDSLTDSIRAGYDKPDRFAGFIGALLGKFTTGVFIGLGIAVGLAIARAGVGL